MENAIFECIKYEIPIEIFERDMNSESSKDKKEFLIFSEIITNSNQQKNTLKLNLSYIMHVKLVTLT